MPTLQPLSTFPVGSRVVIKQLGECPKGRVRLCAMGLTPGTFVEIEDVTCGPCRVRVRGASMVLGKGMAEHILCCPEEVRKQCATCPVANDSVCYPQ